MRVMDVMERQPYVVTAADPVAQVARTMRDFNLGLVPVVDDRGGMRVRGVITERDLVVRHVAAGCPPRQRAQDVMTRYAWATLRPDDGIEDALARMQGADVQQALVTGDEERLLGIVSARDLRARSDRRQISVEKLLREVMEAPTLVEG